jgi:hypothetical protein
MRREEDLRPKARPEADQDLGVVGGKEMMPFAVARGEESEGRVRVLVDASKDGGEWWFPQYPPRFDPEKPHQGTRLASYLKERGYTVRELPRGMADMSGELRDVDLVIRVGDFEHHNPGEVRAYLDFLSRGGALFLVANIRREGARDPLAEALGVRFEGIVRGQEIGRWADHPVTKGLPPLSVYVASVVTRWPESATPLAWLARTDPPPPDTLVMGALRFERYRGKILFLSSLLFLEEVPQPLTAQALDWLLGEAPGVRQSSEQQRTARPASAP